MATLLEITNQVLLRLREDTVSDLSDDYAALIASFVADIVQELNECVVWNFLDHELTVSVVPGTVNYSLTGTNNKSQLLFDPVGRPQAWIFDDSNDPEGEPMFYLDPSEYYRRYQADRALTNDKPQWFTLEKDTDNDELVMRLWPEPSASKYIRIRFNTPEAELDPTTDAAVEIKMPARLVRLGALEMALNERGEEIGEPGNQAESRYEAAKGAAIEEEMRIRERAGYLDWSRN